MLRISLQRFAQHDIAEGKVGALALFGIWLFELGPFRLGEPPFIGVDELE
jgi:hypothetical protein